MQPVPHVTASVNNAAGMLPARTARKVATRVAAMPVAHSNAVAVMEKITERINNNHYENTAFR